MLLISRLINRSGLRISHSKVFSSAQFSIERDLSILVNGNTRVDKKGEVAVEKTHSKHLLMIKSYSQIFSDCAINARA